MRHRWVTYLLILSALLALYFLMHSTKVAVRALWGNADVRNSGGIPGDVQDRNGVELPISGAQTTVRNTVDNEVPSGRVNVQNDYQRNEVMETSDPGGNVSDRRKLVLVQVLFAHGHTSPPTLYRNDPNPISLWPHGPDKLTELGASQASKLGTHLREFYWDFLSYNPREAHCMSCNAERCLSAARRLLMSLYLPFAEITELPERPPVPIDHKQEEPDEFFPTIETCRSSRAEWVQIMETPESQQFIQKHQQWYEFWSNRSGNIIRNYESAAKLYEILNIEAALQLEIPKWAQLTWDQLRYQADMRSFFRCRTLIMRRLMAGPLIALMIDRMWKKADSLKDESKIYLYSGTPDNVAVLLQSLGFFHLWTPPPASCIIFELYWAHEDNISVRILFSNPSSMVSKPNPPQVLVLPGNTEYCPFADFVQFVQHLLSQNWEAECQLGLDASVMNNR